MCNDMRISARRIRFRTAGRLKQCYYSGFLHGMGMLVQDASRNMKAQCLIGALDCQSGQFAHHTCAQFVSSDCRSSPLLS